MEKKLYDILSWIEARNQTTKVEINKINFTDCKGWFLDEKDGCIRNANNTFFQIAGLREMNPQGEVILEQPILLQSEIGYLGIICKDFDGATHFLMQAKIEPGNVNKIQISPTIQATKSNFTQKHGGRKPVYLEYFINAQKEQIIVDQIQSEQSARFLGKRNRNIIIKVEEEVEVLPSHMWMTLPQIKELMKLENLVNMDTRTVLSCIPFALHPKENWKSFGLDECFLKNACMGDNKNHLPEIYHFINNYKMFEERERRLVPLTALNSWQITDKEIAHKQNYPFKVIFCEIEIEGREVVKWCQPLFEAIGKAFFGLLRYSANGIWYFIVKAAPETGCFDKIELGPTIQREAGAEEKESDWIQKLFWQKYYQKQGVIFDTVLSEEGGRFYHEQNHNVIIEVDQAEVGTLPDGYFAVDLRTLNLLTQVNNCLNIQLRNLLSVLGGSKDGEI